jgi:hypothetical protein
VPHLQTELLTLFSCSYIPFAICGLLLLLDVAVPWLEKTGRFRICLKLGSMTSRFQGSAEIDDLNSENILL